MEILVAILIIALIAAIAFAVLQRRPSGARGVQGPRASPLGRRNRGVARHDPMAAAVEEHARAMDPADVVVAEQRLRAEARNIAARLRTDPPAGGHPGAPAPVAGHPGAPASMGPSVPIATDPSLDAHYDPVTGERIDGYGDPAHDPRYDDPRYDGRLAADWVDPRTDGRVR